MRRHEVGDRPVRRLEGVRQLIIRHIVEDTVHHVRVGGDVRHPAVEDFTDCVDAGGGDKGWPEVLSDVFDGINSEAVDAEHA